jgi:hypothetical protein
MRYRRFLNQQGRFSPNFRRICLPEYVFHKKQFVLMTAHTVEKLQLFINL